MGDATSLGSTWDGGVRIEEGAADVALVLYPHAFGEMGFDSVTALLPPSRTNVRGMVRLGFEPDGETEIGGVRFIRYRLSAERFRAGH